MRLSSQGSFCCATRLPSLSTKPVIILLLCRSIPAIKSFISVSLSVWLLLFSSANERQLFTVGRPSPSTPLMFISPARSHIIVSPSHLHTESLGHAASFATSADEPPMEYASVRD